MEPESIFPPESASLLDDHDDEQTLYTRQDVDAPEREVQVRSLLVAFQTGQGKKTAACTGAGERRRATSYVPYRWSHRSSGYVLLQRQLASARPRFVSASWLRGRGKREHFWLVHAHSSNSVTRLVRGDIPLSGTHLEERHLVRALPKRFSVLKAVVQTRLQPV